VFHRYATLDCTGTSTDQTVALTPGNSSTAVSDNFAAIANLSYRADYLGDANYQTATGACEPLTVTSAPAPAIAIVKNPATQSVPVGGKARFKIHGHERGQHHARERDGPGPRGTELQPHFDRASGARVDGARHVCHLLVFAREHLEVVHQRRDGDRNAALRPERDGERKRPRQGDSAQTAEEEARD
jgi:hypothetical protein